jgi:hypothetical protein
MSAKIQAFNEKSNTESKKIETFFTPTTASERMNFPLSIVKGNKDPKVIKYVTFAEIIKKLESSEDTDLQKSKSLLSFYQSNKTAYNELKESLYGFIVGRFEYRANDKCTLYVPVLCFDIDSLKFPSLTISDCKNIPYIFAAFPSPSGCGLRVLVWCRSTPETHRAYYDTLILELSERLNIPTDKQLKAQKITLKDKAHFDSSTSNLSRLWYIAAVPSMDIYLNLESVIYTLLSAEPNAATKIERPIKRPQNTEQSHSEPVLRLSEKIELAERMTNERNISNGRNNTVFFLCCLLNEMSVPENDILDYAMTYLQDDFNQSEINKTVKSAIKNSQKGKFSDLQLIKYRNNGQSTPGINFSNKNTRDQDEVKSEVMPENVQKLDFDEGYIIKKEQPKILQMKAYLENRYDIKCDIVSNEIEYKRKNETKYKIINENDLIVELLSVGFKGVESPLMALLNSNFVRRFDPFIEYFESLPTWNEIKPDYIRQLASYVKAKDREWFDIQFKKMLVRSVAGAIKAIPFNKHCFVLMSSQNDGKSTFLRDLCPPALVNYITENIEIDNKDGRIALCQNFFINLDELSKLNKKDVNTIKSFISQDKVKDRLPYAKKAQTFQRRANFIGSTNKGQFLIDETGNVRWLIFEIKGIQHDNGKENGYNKNVDIDLVWSQAYSLFKSGFNFQLTADELRKSESNNTSFIVKTPEIELIQQYFIAADESDSEMEFLAATEITERLTLKTTIKINPVSVGKALTALKFSTDDKFNKELGYQKKGYFVKERNKI